MTETQAVSFSSRRTAWIGLGFLGVSLAWALYNTYVPVLLKERFALGSVEVGWIGTGNNLLTLLLLPIFGAWSDRTRTGRGRRFPFILFGAPIGAALLAAIPFLADRFSLPAFILGLAGFNWAMAVFRSPLVALMPDLTPSPDRSRGNAIINLMGGVGALLAYFGGKKLQELHPGSPFQAGALVLAAACLITVTVIREPSRHEAPLLGKGAFEDLIDGLREVFQASEKSPVFLLFSLLAWSMGFNAIGMFFTTYSKFYLGWSEADGGMVLGFFALAFIASAVGAGRLSLQFGRAPIIRVGLVILIVNLLLLPLAHAFAAVATLMAIAGMGWAWVNVNSLPMLLDSVPESRIGAYTGVYYLFSMAGGVIAPPIAGLAMDRFGFGSLPIACAVFYIFSWIGMYRVHRGEASS